MEGDFFCKFFSIKIDQRDQMVCYVATPHGLISIKRVNVSGGGVFWMELRGRWWGDFSQIFLNEYRPKR